MSGTNCSRLSEHLSGKAARSLPEARQAASRTGQESSEKHTSKTERRRSARARSREEGPRSSFVDCKERFQSDADENTYYYGAFKAHQFGDAVAGCLSHSMVVCLGAPRVVIDLK